MNEADVARLAAVIADRWEGKVTATWNTPALVRALLPVVREIADQRAAEELESAADGLPYAPAAKAQWLRDRAAALRGGTDA